MHPSRKQKAVRSGERLLVSWVIYFHSTWRSAICSNYLFCACVTKTLQHILSSKVPGFKWQSNKLIPELLYYYHYYFCLFSSTSMYVMNSFSLLLAYWCVGIRCLDHLFHHDFLMVFIPCFEFRYYGDQFRISFLHC